MARIVVLDHAGDAQGALKRLAAHRSRLDVDDVNAVGIEGDQSLAEVEPFLAFINRDQLHAANGTLARLVGFNPRVHGALIIKNLAAPGRSSSGSGVFG